MSWLLTRGYAPDSSLKLVGDRCGLAARLRQAVIRCSCSDQSRAARQMRQLAAGQLAGAVLDIDGFNVLTTIEAALADGVIIAGRDGCYRDMASMHGSYRTVAETRPALELVGRWLQGMCVARCCWWLDRPVSNSGRLKSLMTALAVEQGWPWEITLLDDPDGYLQQSRQIVATADSVILDHCGSWFPLARAVVDSLVPAARILRLAPDAERVPQPPASAI